MKIYYRSNLAAGCAAILLGAAVFALIPSQIAAESGTAYGITSRTLPSAVAAMMCACGAGLVVQSLVFKKDQVKELDIAQETKGVLYMLALLLYGIGLSYSFLISTALLGTVTLAFMGCRKVSYYVIILALTAAIYLTFTQLLHVRLP